MKENLKFDRLESDKDNYYSTKRGSEEFENFQHEGFFKCKLVHTKGKSIIVPDLIYIMKDEENFGWIQYYSFMACYLQKSSEDQIDGFIFIDIAFGQTIKILISHKKHVKNLKDNSNLYKCIIEGPKNIHEYYTGSGKIVNNIPHIYLFHHTLPQYKELILKGSSFKCSSWNYQGTKRLSNFSYCYFTSLPSIQKPSDLRMIAMASNGKLQFIVDLTNEIVDLKVYRESTSNRQASIKMLIDSTIIENNHLWLHEHASGLIYYERSNPFVYRIGAENNTNIQFTSNQISRQKNIKLLNYIIIGDARLNDGIIGPFHEEETDFIFKIEEFPNNESNILKFWFENVNTDLFTNKHIDGLEFERT